MVHPVAMLAKTEDWAAAWPGAAVGMLVVRNTVNCVRHEGLQAEKDRIQSALRARFPTADALKADPVLLAYRAYYKGFGKTYHVLGQLESVALKGRGLPVVNGLVDTMFLVELKNRLLTAVHDLDACAPPFTVASAAGGERFTTMRGEEKEPKRGDMLIRDGSGIISSILDGPDLRTRVTADTRNAVYMVYAPKGIPEDMVRAHLEDVRACVRLFCPEAATGEPVTVTA